MNYKKKDHHYKAAAARELAYAIGDDLKLMLVGHRDARDFFKGTPEWQRHYWYFEGAVDFSKSITETLARRLYELFEIEEMKEIIDRVEAEDGGKR